MTETEIETELRRLSSELKQTIELFMVLNAPLLLLGQALHRGRKT